MSKGSESAAARPKPEGVGEFSKSALQQSEWWFKLQMGLFNQLQATNTRWVEHRTHDLNNWLNALHQLAACKDVGEAAAVQHEWVAQCMHAAVAEWTDLMRPFAEHRDAHTKRTKELAVSVQKLPERAAA
jgi:hypothetical protein